MKSSYIRHILTLIVLFILLLNSGVPVTVSIPPEKIRIQNVHSTDDFDDAIRSYMETAHWPSLAVAILKNNSMVWSHGYGYADIRHQRVATNTTVYMLASISKTFTATALMQLWEKGLFNLDDDINAYLPFPVRNPYFPDVPITFRMLLTHRSGISSNYIQLFILFSLLRVPNEQLGEYLNPGGRFYSPKHWQNVQPGTTQIYSCVGYELLGLLVEQLSHQSLPEYCTEHIFEPLAMHNTSYHLSDYSADQLAVQYMYVAGRYAVVPAFEDRNYASGGLRSNLEDLSHYLLAYMNHGEYYGVHILQNSTVDLMFTLQYPSQSYIGYGLGWQIYTNHNSSQNNLRIGHNGGMPGMQTYMFYHVSDGAGIIIFANQHLMYSWTDMSNWFGLIDLLIEKAKAL